MSYDLHLCCAVDTELPVTRFARALSNFPNFTYPVNTSDNFQAFYENHATGVYFLIDFDQPGSLDEPLALPPSHRDTGFTVRVNFNRPSFFAHEAMPIVTSVCHAQNLLVADPQESPSDPMVPRNADAVSLIDSWERHNNSAVRALHAQNVPGDEVQYLYYDRQKAHYWWLYMKDKEALQNAAEDDIFVPSIVMLKDDASRVFSAVVWSDALPQVFPKADFVLKHAMTRRRIGAKKTKSIEILAWDKVIQQLQPLLHNIRGPVAGLQFIPSASAGRARKIFDALHGTDFRGYELIQSQDFVDVPLENKSQSQ